METMEQGAPQPDMVAAADGPLDLASMWERLEPGLKAKAMHEVYENQQKKVIEIQREQMNMMDELAIAVVKARAAVEMGQQTLSEEIKQGEIEPLREKLRAIQKDIEEANAMLDAYQAIGRGIL